MKRLVSIEDAEPSDHQHTTPCADCPWSPNSLPGWLGGTSVNDWLETARGEGMVMCHTVGNQQCAGTAIFRANTGKLCRDSSILRLPPARTIVFPSPVEFIKHHDIERPLVRKPSTKAPKKRR